MPAAQTQKTPPQRGRLCWPRPGAAKAARRPGSSSDSLPALVSLSVDHSHPLLACGLPLPTSPDPSALRCRSLPAADAPLRAPQTRKPASPAASRPGYLPRCERLRCFRSPTRRALFYDALLRRRSVCAHPPGRASCPPLETSSFGLCLPAGSTPCTGRLPLSRLA